MSHTLSDNQHFFVGKSIPAHDVAIPASRHYVVHRVPAAIVQPVAAKSVGDAAIDTGLGKYMVQHVLVRNVADHAFFGVNLPVSRSEKARPAFYAPVVFVVSSLYQSALCVCKVGPALCAPIFSNLSRRHACSALIGQSERARGVTRKHLRRCWQFLFATVADSVVFKSGAAINSHAPFYFNERRNPLKDGPHYQLPWKEYP